MTTAVRPLAERDADWAADLYHRSSYEQLTPEQRRREGFVQGRMSAELLTRMAGSDMPALVADVDGAPAGLLLSHPWGAAPAESAPGRTEQVAREAGLEDSFLHGPALVAPEARGHGMMRALAQAMLEAVAGRFRWAVALVEDSNAVSAAVHERLGFRPVGSFSIEERHYTVLAQEVPAAQ